MLLCIHFQYILSLPLDKSARVGYLHAIRKYVCASECVKEAVRERQQWENGGGGKALQTNCSQKSNFIYYWRRCQGEQFAGLPVPGGKAWVGAESAAMPSTPTSSHLYSQHTHILCLSLSQSVSHLVLLSLLFLFFFNSGTFSVLYMYALDSPSSVMLRTERSDTSWDEIEIIWRGRPNW